MDINVFTACLAVVLVIAAVIAETFAQQQFTKAQYTMKPVPSSTDLSGASKTFPNTRSTIECGVKCSQNSLEAFFLIKQTAMCYCSDYVDVVDEPNPEEGHIKYGYIANAVKSTPMFPSCGTASSSWTTFQRRMDGSVDFYRTWEDYVNGFGRSDGEFWLGLEEIHKSTAAGCELCIYLEAGPESSVESGFAMYSSFSVGSAATKYLLLVDGFSGSPGIGDSLAYNSGRPFSTYDNDNDAWPTGNCAVPWSGGWWYNHCARANLNGLYTTGTQTTAWQAIVWNHPWGYYFGLKTSEMSYRCV